MIGDPSPDPRAAAPTARGARAGEAVELGAREVEGVIFQPALGPPAGRAGGRAAHPQILARITAQLARDAQAGRPRHHLIVGAAGSGKTTLLPALADAVAADPALAGAWRAAFALEAPYRVGQLSDVWRACLARLEAPTDGPQTAGSTAHPAGRRSAPASRDLGSSERDADAEVGDPLGALRAAATADGRRLVVLIDRLDAVDARVRAAGEGLAAALAAAPELVVIGAWAGDASARPGVTPPERTDVHVLAPISPEAAAASIDRLAGADTPPLARAYAERHPGALEATCALLGGTPRVLALIRRRLAAAPDAGADVLVASVLDALTPGLLAPIEGLAAQAQRVFAALAEAWEPVRASALAARCGLATNVASAQLDRLARAGLVDKVAHPPGARLGFLVSDRASGLAIGLRSGPAARGRLWATTRALADALAPPRPPSTYHPFVVAAGLLHLERWPEAERTLADARAAALAVASSDDREAAVALLAAAFARGRLAETTARLGLATAGPSWTLVARAAAVASGEDAALARSPPELRGGIVTLAQRIRGEGGSVRRA